MFLALRVSNGEEGAVLVYGTRHVHWWVGVGPGLVGLARGFHICLFMLGVEWSGVGIVGSKECFFVLFLVLLVVPTCTRGNMSVAKAIVRRKAGRPVRRTAIHLLDIGSDSVVKNVTASHGKDFVLGGVGGNDCLLRISFIKFSPLCRPLHIAKGAGPIGLNGLTLASKTVRLNRTIIVKGTPRMAMHGSAVRCGTSSCGAARNSVLRSLLGGVPNIRISDRKGVAIGKGRVGGMLVSKGRFFSSSPGMTSGGLPSGVVSGMRILSGLDSVTGVAKFSSKRRRAIVGLAIGPKVGRN